MFCEFQIRMKKTILAQRPTSAIIDDVERPRGAMGQLREGVKRTRLFLWGSVKSYERRAHSFASQKHRWTLGNPAF